MPNIVINFSFAMARGGKSSSGPSKPKSRASKASTSALPEVYQELLADALTSTPALLNEDGRSVKRRRVGGRVVTYGGDLPVKNDAVSTAKTTKATNIQSNHDLAAKFQQVIYNDSENSADSDMDWEEVGFNDKVEAEISEADEGELNLVLGSSETIQKEAVYRRKPISVTERKTRLEIHKMHVLSLLVHIHLRNHWCNDPSTQV